MPTLTQLRRWMALPGFDGLQRECDIPWRPFEEARAFARGLKLKSVREWEAYSKSGERLSDIPSNPEKVYNEWKGWGDWLGTGNVWSKTWRPFTKARTFAHSLMLKSQTEWDAYSKSGKRPNDIPSKPGAVYEEFAGWGDWLGTGNVCARDRHFRPFNKARRFVRSLGLRGYKDWKAYRKSGKKPKDIPSNPYRTYKEFTGYEDWLNSQHWRSL